MIIERWTGTTGFFQPCRQRRYGASPPKILLILSNFLTLAQWPQSCRESRLAALTESLSDPALNEGQGGRQAGRVVATRLGHVRSATALATD